MATAGLRLEDDIYGTHRHESLPLKNIPQSLISNYPDLPWSCLSLNSTVTKTNNQSIKYVSKKAVYLLLKRPKTNAPRPAGGEVRASFPEMRPPVPGDTRGQEVWTPRGHAPAQGHTRARVQRNQMSFVTEPAFPSAGQASTEVENRRPRRGGGFPPLQHALFLGVVNILRAS